MAKDEPNLSSHEKALNIADDLLQKGKARQEQLKKEGVLTSSLLGTTRDLAAIATAINEDGVVQNGISEEYLGKLQKQLDLSEQQSEAIRDTFPGVVKLTQGVDQFAKTLSLLAAANPLLAIVAAGVALFKLFTGIAKKIAETRKDLGVSAIEAVKLEAAFFGLEKVAALSGLEAEDLKNSFAAARDNLGATTDEALGLSLSLAKTAMRSGQTASQLTTTLSLMESISGASRDALLSQIEMTGQMLEQKGLAPGDIFKDVADNAEHFASFAKDGGANIFAAAASAKKLGLNMSAVASTTEALLNFETSIEKQMEASLLLGRQINLDRARQLALSGDQEGMMQEILKQVGGEAEFNRLNVLQRRALAESVGQSVENLSRLVRNNTATTTAGTVAKTSGDSVFNAVSSGNAIQENIHTEIRGLRKEMTN